MNPQFEIFNQKTLPANSFRGADEDPALSLTSGNVIRFNQAATHRLGLKEGVLVSFRRDKRLKDWYVEIGAADGYPIRKNTEKRGSKVYPSFQFGHGEICRMIRNDLDKQGTLAIPLDKTDTPGLFQLATRQVVVRPEKKYAPRSTPVAE